MSTIEPILIDAYSNAVYRIRHNDSLVEFCIDTTSLELDHLLGEHSATTGAFITACNPQSSVSSLEENLQFHEQLAAMLQAMQLRWLDGEGGDRAGNWEPEKSVLILDISKESATALAIEHGQNAFVWIQREQPPELVLTR